MHIFLLLFWGGGILFAKQEYLLLIVDRVVSADRQGSQLQGSRSPGLNQRSSFKSTAAPWCRGCLAADTMLTPTDFGWRVFKPGRRLSYVDAEADTKS